MDYPQGSVLAPTLFKGAYTWYSASSLRITTAEALRYGTCSQGCTSHTFIRNRNEPHLPLPSQSQLVLIYRPRSDGRLSRPWCEVAQAEIRTRNLPTANPALYHTASSAPTNDLPVTIKYRIHVGYADDSCCAVQEKSFEEVERTLTSDMAKIAEYCRRWRLKPSAPKQCQAYFTCTIEPRPGIERQFERTAAN